VTTRDNNPKQEELETLYCTLSNQMRACYIPIISFDKLTLSSGTCPPEEELIPDVEEIVNTEIFHHLLKAIPVECTSLCAILESYMHSQDSYGALTHIMKTTCSYLKTFQPTWGPIWLS
jgi:hypothetical protein